jgi:hypothetical protein
MVLVRLFGGNHGLTHRGSMRYKCLKRLQLLLGWQIGLVYVADSSIMVRNTLNRNLRLLPIFAPELLSNARKLLLPFSYGVDYRPAQTMPVQSL